MRRVQTTSIAGLPWQQQPGTFLSSKQEMLSTYYLTDSPYRTVAWSETNLIAFCGSEGIHRGVPTDDPLLTSLYATFEPHKPNEASAIHHNIPPPDTQNKEQTLRRSSTPLPGRPENDTAPTGSQAKAQRTAGHFSSTKQSPSTISCLSHVIFISDPTFPSQHFTLITPHQARIKHLSFSPKALGPLLVSADEGDRVCLWSMKEHACNEWQCDRSFSIPHVVAIHWVPLAMYSLPNPTDPTPHADITAKFRQNGYAYTTQASAAFLAICRNSDVYLVHRMAFEKRWNMTCIRLPSGTSISRSDLVFVPRYPASTVDASLTSLSHPEPRTAFLALCGPSLANRIAVFQLDLALPSHITNKPASLECKLECLIELPSSTLTRSNVIHIQFDRSFPLHGNASLQSLVVVTSTGKSCRVRKLSPQLEQRIPGKSTYMNVADFETKETGEDSSLISLVSCFSNGDVLLAYSDGTIEIRQGDTLALIETKRHQTETPCKRAKKEEDTVMNDVKGETMEEPAYPTVGQPQASPLAIAVSPNQCMFCIVDYHIDLHVFVRDNPLTPGKQPQSPQLMGRILADVFERSMVSGSSYWDALMFFRDMCNKNTEQFLYSVIRWLFCDYLALTPDCQNDFYLRFQALYAALLRISETQTVNFINYQACLHVGYIHDTFIKYLLHIKSPTVDLSDIKNFKPNDWKVRPEIVVPLYALADWALLFAVFFLRNIYDYLKTPDNESEVQMSRMSLSPDLRQHGNTHTLGAAGIDEKITAVLVQHEIHSDLIGTLSVQLLEARNIIKSIPRGEEYSSAYFQQAKRELKNKLRVNDFGAELEKIRSLSQLFRELDIAVPAVGFIDQNQIRKSLKREHGEHTYEYHQVPISLTRKVDVISRVEIRQTNRTNRKISQCTQCNRFVKWPAETENTSLHRQWAHACPLCGGSWKAIHPTDMK